MLLQTEIVVVFLLFAIRLSSTREMYQKGDVILGGLFPVHEKVTIGRSRIQRCGNLTSDPWTRSVEAMIFAIHRINNQTQLLPTIRLGFLVMDNCCSHPDDPKDRDKWFQPEDRDLTAIVKGHSASTDVSLQVIHNEELFGIPERICEPPPEVIVYAVSLPTPIVTTFDKAKQETQAVYDLVRHLNWTYVSRISDPGFSSDSIDAEGICFAVDEVVWQEAGDQEYFSIVRDIIDKPKGRVILLMLSADQIRKFLKIFATTGKMGNFLFILREDFLSPEELFQDAGHEAIGTLVLRMRKQKILDFEQHLIRASNASSDRTPFSAEYTSGVAENGASDRSHATMTAVYAFAQSLDRAWMDKCSPEEAMCPALRQMQSFDFFQQYISGSKVTDFGGTVRQIDDNHMISTATYDIRSLQALPDGSGLHYVTVGSWAAGNGIHLDHALLHFPHEDGRNSRIPESVCSTACSDGQIRVLRPEDTCCWDCHTCNPSQFLNAETNECVLCPIGEWPIEDQSSCDTVQILAMDWHHILAIGPICLSVVGILLTLCTAGIFVWNSETPIVKASGRELCALLLIGILITFCQSFILLAKPSICVCTVRRFSVSTAFSLMYSALLTKTNRIARIFRSASQSTRRPKFLSPVSQIAIVGALTSIQLVISGIWYLADPPSVREDFPDIGFKDKKYRTCGASDDMHLISLSYNALLIIVCTIYAAMTHKVPENFNEAKFIGFTMYTTSLIWLSFLPLHFGTSGDALIRLMSLSVAVSLSAGVVLILIFGPKCFIILFKAENNVRQRAGNLNVYNQQPGKKCLPVSATTATTSSDVPAADFSTLSVTKT